MLTCSAAGTTRYRPRSASNALKEIVEDSLEDLLASWQERYAPEHGPLHPRVKKLFEAFTRFGGKAGLGGPKRRTAFLPAGARSYNARPGIHAPERFRVTFPPLAN